MELRFLNLEFGFPSMSEPSWAPLVERWYQLDAPSFGLCELYTKYQLKDAPKPEMIYLASLGSSNQTDLAFVNSGASSPAKFVHTLPNIRGSVLAQVMGWHGPMLCLQNDPNTLSNAIEMISLEERPTWILGSANHGSTGLSYALLSHPGNLALGRALTLQKRQGDKTEPSGSLLEWLMNPHGKYPVASNWELKPL